jgi:hypothetical protein
MDIGLTLRIVGEAQVRGASPGTIWTFLHWRGGRLFWFFSRTGLRHAFPEGVTLRLRSANAIGPRAFAQAKIYSSNIERGGPTSHAALRHFV